MAHCYAALKYGSSVCPLCLVGSLDNKCIEKNAKLAMELKAKFYFMWFKTDNTIYKGINVIFCLISISTIRYWSQVYCQHQLSIQNKIKQFFLTFCKYRIKHMDRCIHVRGVLNCSRLIFSIHQIFMKQI